MVAAALPGPARPGRPPWAALGFDLILGAAAALGQAPWGLWPLTVLALALLCSRIARAPGPRPAAWHAFAAGMGHFAQADAAETKLAVDRVGSAALLAAGVSAHAELRLAGLLDLECCLCHCSAHFFFLA